MSTKRRKYGRRRQPIMVASGHWLRYNHRLCVRYPKWFPYMGVEGGFAPFRLRSNPRKW